MMRTAVAVLSLITCVPFGHAASAAASPAAAAEEEEADPTTRERATAR